ncbi:MAG: extracellular solute-binding protein [Anaerolineae bacterium]|nr:extracellular solute-binding protein [Anaerolineae bacterium]
MEAVVKKYEADHPNVKIVREAKSMDDLKATLALALKSDDSPDVAMINQGESDMGAYVKAGLLLPMDDYAKKFGWFDKFPQSLVRLNSWTKDGAKMGEGNFYGIPILAEVVGVYYRKDLFEKYGIAVPATFAEFEAAIATLKSNGETPIIFGNLDGWPAIHTYSELQNVYQASRTWYDDFMFMTGKVTFDTPENLKAAQTLKTWAEEGVFMDGFAGVGYDDSYQLFGAGQGAMLLTGSWLSGDLSASPMADNIGFFVVPPLEKGGYKLTVGGTGFAFGVSAKSQKPDLAAEYINYLYSEETAKDLLAAGFLPVYPVQDAQISSGLLADIVAAWNMLGATNSVGYYMDWVTPTMYDTITASLQELMGGKITPEEFVAKVNDDYVKGLEAKGIQ